MIGCHSCVFSDLDCRVPDARTIWLFREKLTKAGAIGPLFERFDATLRQSGYIAMSGQIVDASLIAAPRQRNTQDEKKAIKDGRIPDAWKDKPAKLRQKDRDARWTVKYTQGQAARGWIDAAGRSGDSGLRLSEPHLARSRFRLHSQMERDRRRCGPPSARGTSRQDQHGEQRLGGHRLQI